MDWLNQMRTSDDINSQGSDAWKAWRKKGLGGSDSAALLGWSPYKTAMQLWEEKVGLSEPTFGTFQIAAMERGKKLEPEIRRWYEEKVGAIFSESVAEHKEHSFIRASYDGINTQFKNPDGSLGRILEIKAPNRHDHAMAAANEVPPKYLTQLNWMGIVSGIQWFDYVSYGSDGTYHIVTLQADGLIQAELFERALSMWGYISTKTRPPLDAFQRWTRPMKPLDLSKAEEHVVSEQETEILVQDALFFQGQIDYWETKFEEVKTKLKNVLGDQEKMQCGDAIFGWQTRKGNVDYGRIPEIQSVDLDQYRKDDIRAFYFKRSPK